MKTLKALMSFILLASANLSPAQQITVGAIIDDSPVLNLTDAQLSDTLAFVLNGATLLNAQIVSATDTFGLFYYIRATANRPGQANPSEMAVILSVDGDTLLYDPLGGCTMECIAQLPCTGCSHTILEKCKRQICNCKSNSGGCSSNITF